MADFYVSNSNGRFTLKLSVTERPYDIATNTSIVDYVLTLIANTSYHFSGYAIGRSITINGSNVVNVSKAASSAYTLSGNSSIQLASGALSIPHNDDGSKTISLAFSIDMTSESFTPGPLYGSGNMALTTIPRKTTIAVTDANIGAVASLYLNIKSGSFTHKLQYSTNGSSYVDITSNPSTNPYPWTVPVSFYALIPNIDYLYVHVKVITYNGGSVVGEDDTTFKASVSKDVNTLPTIAFNVYDNNVSTVGLTDDPQKIIKYFSTAHCELTVTTRASATEKDKSVTVGDGKKSTVFPCNIANVESGHFDWLAHDSRNFPVSDVTNLTLIEYVKLTCNPVFKRPSPTSGEISVTLNGNFWGDNFGKEQNNLHVTISYRKKGDTTWIAVPGADWWEAPANNLHDFTIDATNRTYSKTVSLGVILTYKDAVEFYVSVNDRLTNVYCTPTNPACTVAAGEPMFDYGKNASGELDFAYHIPVIMDKPLSIADNLSALSITGFYYSSDTANDDTALKAYLDTCLAKMPDHSQAPCTLKCYPAWNSGCYYIGTLYKATNDYAIWMGYSYDYDGAQASLVKRNGIWQTVSGTSNKNIINYNFTSGMYNNVASIAEYIRYSKYGKLVIIDVGGINFTATGQGIVFLSGIPIMRTRPVCFLHPDNVNLTATRVCCYGNLGQTTIYHHVPTTGVAYYGQIIYLTD